MDFPPPPPPPPSTTIDAPSDTLPAVPNAKLRLMCSYGGHIVTRPHNKSLCYAGGDTRIVAVDRRTTAATLSSLVAHLSRVLYNNRPFTLKYQLPNEDLDSLISVTADEDLHNMLEEHDRIVSSPNPSRIRLFLFPLKTESIGSVLSDSKAESWFCDALKGTKIMQRGQTAESGLVNGLMDLDFVGNSDSSLEAQVESLCNGGETKNGLDLSNVHESMVLETSSSFGSTSSSTSMSNLPPIGVHSEDGGVNLQNNKVKMPLSGSMESDNSVASAVSHSRTYHDPLVHITSVDTRVSSNTIESESGVTESSSGIHLLKTVPISGYQLSSQSDQKQQQQEVQYVPAVAHYVPQYPSGPLPMSSYYPMYHPPLHQQHYSHYQPNQPYPIYLLPVRDTQPHNMSVQCNLIETATAASSRPPLHPHTTLITPTVASKEVEGAPPTPELATKVYRTVPGATPLVSVPSNQKQQQFVGPPEPVYPSQSIATATMATSNYDKEFDDNLAYNQIYKTQPSAPGLSIQYQSMMKATPGLLSEAASQLHPDNNKLVGASQPQ